MNNRVFLVLPLLILAALVSVRSVTPRVNAAPELIGLVCLGDPSIIPNSNPCPSSPWTFNGPPPSPSVQTSPTQIEVGVFVSNSDALRGFDITLNASSTVLKPAGIDLTGTVLPPSGTLQPFVALLCVGGTLIVGTICSVNDTATTLHLAAVAQPGAPPTFAPTSGLLFTAIYNITGTTPSGGIPIGFQNGCTRSSITGPSPHTCITIGDGSNAPVPETVQTGAIFDNSVAPNWVSIAPNSATLTVLSGVTSKVNFTATAQNGWPNFSIDSITFTAPSKTLTTAFIPNTCSTLGTSCQVTLSVSGITGGTYSLTIFGKYVFTDPNLFLTDTLIGQTTIQVTVQDVAWTVLGAPYTSSQTMYFARGVFTLPYVFTSLGGYSGSLAFGTGACNGGTTGVVCPAVYPPQFTLSAGQTVTKLINFTATGEGRLLIRSTLIASQLTTKSSAVYSFLVSGFSLTPNATSIFTLGNSHALALSVSSLGSSPTTSFAGPIALSSTSTPSGLSVSFSPTSQFLTSGGTSSVLVNFASATPGVYTVHIIGTGGTSNLMTNQTAALTIGISSIFFNLTDTFSGLRANLVGTLSIFRASSTLSGSSVMSGFNATTGALIYSKSSSAIVNYNVHGVGHFIQEIPTNPYWLSTNCEIDANLGAASCFLSRTLDVFHTGSVNINDYSFVNLKFGQTLGSPGYDPLADLLAGGRVNIIDISIESLYFGSTVITP